MQYCRARVRHLQFEDNVPRAIGLLGRRCGCRNDLGEINRREANRVRIVRVVVAVRIVVGRVVGIVRWIIDDVAGFRAGACDFGLVHEVAVGRDCSWVVRIDFNYDLHRDGLTRLKQVRIRCRVVEDLGVACAAVVGCVQFRAVGGGGCRHCRADDLDETAAVLRGQVFDQ